MDVILKLFALIGFVVVAMGVLGACGIGDFHMYYGPDATPWHREVLNGKAKDLPTIDPSMLPKEE